METAKNDPNNDAENRLSLGSRKRSSRRSSILKATKSPLKAVLEDRDPNSIGTGKENVGGKDARRSANRRVSFAETNQIKEYEQWNSICQKECLTNSQNKTVQQLEQLDNLPSEYRQPTATIKGIESLLLGSIQDTGQKLKDQFQEQPSMDLTICCSDNFHKKTERQDHLSGINNNRTVVFNQESNEALNSLELTCHGQGLIQQDGKRTSRCTIEVNADQHFYQSGESSQHGKFNAFSFLQSLDSKMNHPNKIESRGLNKTSCTSTGPFGSIPQSLKQEKEIIVKVDANRFLESLGTSTFQMAKSLHPITDASHQQDTAKSHKELFAKSELNDISRAEEEMEMTTCLDIKPDTKDTIPNDGINIHVATGFVDAALSADFDDVMDMTTCALPASGVLENDALVTNAQMDMTTCVPPASTVLRNCTVVSEPQMDMTTCVPPASRVLENDIVVSELQMDMTTCVPPASTVLENGTVVSEPQMDMTTCVIPACTILENCTVVSESHMDETTCVPLGPIDSSIKYIETTLSIKHAHSASFDDDDQYSYNNQSFPVGMDDLCNVSSLNSCANTAPVVDQSQPEIHLNVYQPGDKREWSTSSLIAISEKHQPNGQIVQENTAGSFNRCHKSSNQGWLNHTLPLLGIQQNKSLYLKSKPSLSTSLLTTTSGASKSVPQTTFGPVSHVPISKYCSQSAKKRKMNTQNLSEKKTENQDVENLTDISQKDEEDHKCKDATMSIPGELGDCADLQSLDTTEHEMDSHSVDALDDEGDDDAVITFKKSIFFCSESSSALNTTEMTTTCISGIMEESKQLGTGMTDHLKFKADEKGELINQGTHKVTSMGQPAHDSKQQQARNLSTICEENEKIPNKDFNLPGKRTFMTVEELLTFARVSFCSVLENISRRSTTHPPIKKAEKPKTDKDLIELAILMKPKAIHYCNSSSNTQAELAQLKTKIEEQEQMLNNSNAAILCPQNMEKSSLETNLQELKNICKKCAAKDWIEKQVGMEKKLYLTFKESHELLSKDVSAFDETLGVADDCSKLLDIIDKDLEKKIQILQENISKLDKENVDDVEMSLQQSTTKLEALEIELTQMEDQRSTLISTKGSLSSERQHLEREQLESEELLSQMKIKVIPRESTEQLQEKYEVLRGCLEWQLSEWDDEHARFLFLHETLVLTITFDENSDANKRTANQATAVKQVKHICVSSQLAVDSHVSARFAHFLALHSLSSERLLEMSPTSALLPKALDHVSRLVGAARSIGDELFGISFQNILSVKENSVFVEFSSLLVFIKFVVEFTIDVSTFPDEVGITVIPKIGKNCCQEIEDVLEAVCNTEPKYLSRLVQTARQFLEKK